VFVASEAEILHADLDAFFASVEQRDDRRLRGRPVIVGGGVVLAASYEAKAFGVRTAMGGREARRLCPQAVVVAPRMSAYATIEERGVTLVGVALAGLDDDAAVQLGLPFGPHRASELDATLDKLRDRFGSAAITRAVLVGRDPGVSMPPLPD
jgi:ribosomal protein L13E